MRRKPVTIRVYKAKDGWRWRMRHGNAKIIADSGQAYTRKADASTAASKMVNAIQAGMVIIDERAAA